MAPPLKLRAGDSEDLCVISACMQDALIALSDMSFLPAERRFVLLGTRFRWENCPEFLAPRNERAERAEEPCGAYERVKCALCFDEVTAVRMQDLPAGGGPEILELLAITVGDPAAVPDGRPDGAAEGGPASVTLFFAGGGTVRLEVGRILCHLEDLGAPWPTTRRPSHPLDEGE